MASADQDNLPPLHSFATLAATTHGFLVALAYLNAIREAAAEPVRATAFGCVII